MTTNSIIHFKTLLIHLALVVQKLKDKVNSSQNVTVFNHKAVNKVNKDIKSKRKFQQKQQIISYSIAPITKMKATFSFPVFATSTAVFWIKMIMTQLKTLLYGLYNLSETQNTSILNAMMEFLISSTRFEEQLYQDHMNESPQVISLNLKNIIKSNANYGFP